MKAEIYALCCPDTGEVRYIGKANNAAKRLVSHLQAARSRKTPVYDWVRKLTAQGKQPVLQVLLTAEDWRTEERQAIAQHRAAGARLLNVADGGDEPHCTLEVRRANMAKAQAHPNTHASRSANGKRVAAHRREDPLAGWLWYAKRTLGAALRQGQLREGTKVKMRTAAALNPSVFGCWEGV